MCSSEVGTAQKSAKNTALTVNLMWIFTSLFFIAY